MSKIIICPSCGKETPESGVIFRDADVKEALSASLDCNGTPIFNFATMLGVKDANYCYRCGANIDKLESERRLEEARKAKLAAERKAAEKVRKEKLATIIANLVERKAAEEAERKLAEEARKAKLEAERIAEAKAKALAERKAAAENARLAREKRHKAILVAMIVVSVVLTTLVMWFSVTLGIIIIVLLLYYRRKVISFYKMVWDWLKSVDSKIINFK